MTWTYGGDPSANARDEIRYRVGDTDTNEQLVSDEEIAFQVATNDTTLDAARATAQAILATFARQPTFSTPEQRIELRQRAETYKEMVADLLGGAYGHAKFEVF